MGREIHKYSEEERQFIIDHTEGISSLELSDMFYERFGVRLSPIKIRSYRKRYGLVCGLDGRYKPGRIPVNKGLKQTEYMSPETIERTKATRFKKGHVPACYREVGSQRETVDGYIEVKVDDHKRWKLRSRIVWEEHNGPIPKGCVILHKNGISTDDSIENLVLMTRSQMARLNQTKLMTKNADINAVAINIAKINDLVGKKKGKTKNGKV